MRTRMIGGDWLYGEKFPSGSVPTSMMLRNLLLDIDTLFDLEREIARIVRDSGLLAPRTSDETNLFRVETVATYRLRGDIIVRDRVLELGVPDRNQLELEVLVREVPLSPGTDATAASQVQVNVSSQWATLSLGSPSYSDAERHVMREIGEYLYKNGTQRPDARAVRALAWLTPISIAIGAWIWLSLTVELAPPFHLLILAVLVLASFDAISRVSSAVTTARQGLVGHSFQYRGESRKETHRRRADSRQNWKAALYSAPISIAIGIAGTLFAVALGR